MYQDPDQTENSQEARQPTKAPSRTSPATRKSPLPVKKAAASPTLSAKRTQAATSNPESKELPVPDNPADTSVSNLSYDSVTAASPDTETIVQPPQSTPLDTPSTSTPKAEIENDVTTDNISPPTEAAPLTSLPQDKVQANALSGTCFQSLDLS